MFNNTYNQKETNNSSLDLTLAHETDKMSSLEIAELTGKEHRSILRDIRNLVENLKDVGGYNFVQSSYINKQNKNQPMYELGKKECLLLASGYDVALRAKIINRWEQLEKQTQSLKLPTNYLDALKALVASEEDKQRLAVQNAQQQKVIEAKDAQISDMKDKTAYMDIILQSKSTVTVTQIAQDYGMSAIKFNKLLAELRIQRKVNGQWVLYTPFLNKGYVQSTTQSVPTKDGPSISVMNTQWTQNGRLFLYQLLKQKNILPVIEQKITA